MNSFWKSNCEKKCLLRAQVGKTYITTKDIIGRKKKITLPDSSISNFDASEEIQSALQGHFK